MDGLVEHELCNNCKKEIPQHNYVMHTAHCARNITLCPTCKEPIPKSQFEDHKKTCKPTSPVKTAKKPEVPLTNIEKSNYFQDRRSVEEKKAAARRESYLERHEKFLDKGYSLKSSSSSSIDKSYQGPSPNRHTEAAKTPDKVNGYGGGARSKEKSQGVTIRDTTTVPVPSKPKPKPPSGLLACKYCDLELPKLELEDHENYCGSRTDKCLECGELVMYKYKQLHMDSNHGFLKLNDEPGPRPSWDSQTQRTTTDAPSPRRRPAPFTPFTRADAALYSLPSPTPPPPKEKGESYKEISRRLDCPAPKPPSRKRNPPTELTIPCEFCDTPIPHQDLIQHESGCRPDLARRRKSPSPDDYFIAPQPSSPEVELPSSDIRIPLRRNSSMELLIPCEFCDKPIPQDDLIQHETGCRPDLARKVVSGSPAHDDEGDCASGFHQPCSPEINLPCEFCARMIPASELLDHQDACTTRSSSTETLIPCEFCNTPILQDDLIQHETGCRPDLARKLVSESLTHDEEDGSSDLHQPSSPEIKQPCEFSTRTVAVSEVFDHQDACT